MSDPLLEVSDLKKHYFEQDTLIDRLLGNETVTIHSVDGVSFEVEAGETLGLIGESGCGKSTLGETVLGLRDPTAGTVRFDGQDVYQMDRTERTEFRRRTGIVFQDPFSSLDPRMSAAEILREPLDVHDVGTRAERRDTIERLIERVGLSVDQLDRNPREFSGGQAQRLGIARALALDPDFIVCDEPVSALDVSVQAQVLNLFADIQEEFDLTFLFIAHDLSVIRMISDRVAVMYLGEIVETGDVEAIFDDPEHPYTQGLLESVPRAEISERERVVDPIPGDVPSPRDPPSGCRFHTRCPHAREVCRSASPDRYSKPNGGDEPDLKGMAKCFRVLDDHEYWQSDPLREPTVLPQDPNESDADIKRNESTDTEGVEE
jgi:peptide/nickel transport system ATP-binding protein